MKVLHVIPSLSARSGGPAQAIVPMCRALQEQGAEVMIVTTDEGLDTAEQPKSEDIFSAHSFNGVRTIFFPVQWGKSYKYSRPLSTWLSNNVNKFEVVHIHAVFNHACIAAARACRQRGVPYVVRPLGTLDPWSMKQKPFRKAMFWQLAAKSMMRDAGVVHYTTLAEKEATEQLLGLNHGTVIPLGVDLATSPTSTEPATPMEKPPYVLVLSRLHPKKGLNVLIDGFLNMTKRKEFENWRLVMAGDGAEAYVRSLKQQVEGFEETISFPGWLEGDEKQRILRNASLLALTSYQENFGMCVMEALSCGVPVMVSPHVNLADEIQSINAGWVVPVEKSAIQNCLQEALGSREELSRRGAAGKLLAARFGWPNIATQLLKMYSEVVNLDDRVSVGTVAHA